MTWETYCWCRSENAKSMKTGNFSIADLLGPWVDSGFESGLIERCQSAWNKPLKDLTNAELAMFLAQKIAIEQILPIAKTRLENCEDDETEMYDGQLKKIVEELDPKSR